jgi:hypothetical protein
LVPDEPVEPGAVEDEPEGGVDLVVSVDEGADELGDDVEGDVVVGGDADGVRSPGRSPTCPVPLSVQPAASVATSARAARPMDALFMNAPPHCVRSTNGK